MPPLIVSGPTILVGPLNDLYDEALETLTYLNGHEFCGVCRLCKRILTGTHPDLILSRDSSPEEARNLVSSLRRKPAELKFRMTLILGQKPANYQNILLKSLEEPAPHDYILWVTDSTDTILETVISRCHVQRRVQRSQSPPTDVRNAAEVFMEATVKRDPLKLVLLPASWEDPQSTALFLLNLLLVRHRRGDDTYSFDEAHKLYELTRRNRPAANYSIKMVKR